MHESTSATVLLPTTGEKGPVIQHSLASVLAQSVASIEVFVIGDGAGQSTRDVVHEFQARDSRVKFFDFPKGPRRGENYRHELLTSEARGQIVCYLCDRDLWCHDHLEAMLAALADADLAETHRFGVSDVGEGGIAFQLPIVDLRNSAERRLCIAGGEAPGCLTAVGHTLAMYRQLPQGWAKTPQGLGTDLHMWRKFLRESDCRFAYTTLPTILTFAEATWGEDAARREPALGWWWQRIRRADWQRRRWEIAMESIREYRSRRGLLRELRSGRRILSTWINRLLSRAA